MFDRFNRASYSGSVFASIYNTDTDAEPGSSSMGALLRGQREFTQNNVKWQSPRIDTPKVFQNAIAGLETESLTKQHKYANFFALKENEDIRFTGMFKFVDTGEFDKDGEKIFKRKRIFRKSTKSVR